MDDTSIEIFEEENIVDQQDDILLPENYVSVGKVDPEGVQVYIKQNVYKRIEKFAKEEMSKEVGSILLGDYMDGDKGKAVVISDYIEAKYTDASASTLTFTHETWNYIYSEKEKKYPNKKIVGWQHTHPGYGIFLSSYDVFIQENFFNLPWQIAYVVDPIADRRGFFEWKGSKTSKMPGFYVYDEKGRKIILSATENKSKKPFPTMSVVLASLLLMSVIVSVVFGIENRQIALRLNEVKSELEKPATKAQCVREEYPEDENIETFRIHIVQEGEFMTGICEEYNLDYGENIEKIKQINSLTDENMIYEGQKLYLPMTESAR